MTTSAHKLIATVSIAAALLIGSSAMAKAAGHTPAGNRGPKNIPTTISLKQHSVSRGLQKQQQLRHKDEQDQPGSEMSHVQ
jgi:hypothetical protein